MKKLLIFALALSAITVYSELEAGKKKEKKKKSLAYKKEHPKKTSQKVDEFELFEQKLKEASKLTPLQSAARDNKIDKVISLLSASNITAKEKNKALTLAANRGNTTIIAKLIEEGADVDAKDEFGWTALMEAADEGKLDAVKLLLVSGADVNLRNDKGYTALDYVVTHAATLPEKFDSVGKLLMKHNAKISPELKK